MKKIIIALLIGMMMISHISTSLSESDFELRNGITFGDTLNTIMRKETLSLSSTRDDKAWFEGKIEGIQGEVVYGFDSKTKELIEMLYSFDDFTNQADADKAYNELRKLLNNTYGKPLGNKKGTTHIITGAAFDMSKSIISLYKGFGGKGAYRNYEEWIIKTNDYNVKIDLVCYYYGMKGDKSTYEVCLSYHQYYDSDYTTKVLP